MKRFLVLLLAVFTVFTVAGCGGDGTGNDGDEPSTVEIPAPPNVGVNTAEDAPVVLDVYWDATYSMQGYTTVPQQNVYQNLPDNLEDIGVAMGEAKFFRFGENITPLEGRQHRQFMTSTFYSEVITAVHKVVESADSTHLSVVVTDLFESNADWSNVSKQIKAKYFDQHQSVAVIGIKNPFKGDIFDVGYASNAKIFYDSGADPAKYRPFYMLVMGPDQDVRSFISKCKERIGNGDGIHYLLFTDKLAESIPDLNTMDKSGTTNLFKDSNLAINDKRIVEMGIDDMEEEANLETTFEFTNFNDVCHVDIGKLKPVVKAYYLQDNAWVEEQDESKFNISLEPVADVENTFKWSVKFMPYDVLAPDTIMLMEAFVTPGRDSLQLPDWVREWSMDNQSSFDPNQFDGSKTVNFVRLISSLKDSSMSAGIPSIANMFMVIKND